MTTRIIGSYLSPYVRKALVVLEMKGVPYAIDPIVPFLGDDRFSQVSPLRRVPVLIDDAVTLADSSVICQYLEDRYPDPAVYPAGIADRARARWLEEYADSRMGDVFIWRLFNEVAIKPFVFGGATDSAVVQRTLTEDIPEILSYLEAQLPAAGYLFGTLSIGDIALAVFFRNAAFAGFTVDAERWPRTASFVDRVLASPPFQRLQPFEDRSLRTRPTKVRAALAELGAPLTPDTYGTDTPRRGFFDNV